MPLPVSHSLMGATIYAAADRNGTLHSWGRLLLAVILANAPDLDMLPGLLTGDPNRYHQGPTHSMVGAVFAGLAAALLHRYFGTRWLLRSCLPAGPSGTGMVVGLLWASHVFLDAFTQDFNPPVGVPLLWPFWDRVFNIVPLFPRADKLNGPGDPIAFARSLLTTHNLWAISIEVFVLGPVAATMLWWRTRGPCRRAIGARQRRRGF